MITTFLEISKEKPIFSKKLKIDHMSILNNEYFKINKKYKKIFINDCISNIINLKFLKNYTITG